MSAAGSTRSVGARRYGSNCHRSRARLRSRTTSPVAVYVASRTRTLANDRLACGADSEGGCAGCASMDATSHSPVPPLALRFIPTVPRISIWDIDRHLLALGQPVNTRPRFRVEINRPDRAVIAVERRLGRASSLTMR